MINSKSSKSEIKEYQRVLQAAGLYLSTIDGMWGPGTQRAHAAYVALDTPLATSKSIVAVRNKIIARAEYFLGLTETKSNTRWDDVLTSGQDPRGGELLLALQTTGWQPGWAYCAAFGEVCWRAGYEGLAELPLISRSITPSVMETFENFQKLGRITRVPAIGALMLMQHGKKYQGHMEIVTKLGDPFATIGANTSAGRGSVEQQRNGDGVYRKAHDLDFTVTAGLHLLGFVNPFIL